jgi:Zn finger protein HypA/HybF involved in hydrogenase expression
MPVKEKVKFECMECGTHFKRTIPKNATEMICPKCGGVDVEVA